MLSQHCTFKFGWKTLRASFEKKFYVVILLLARLKYYEDLFSVWVFFTFHFCILKYIYIEKKKKKHHKKLPKEHWSPLRTFYVKSIGQIRDFFFFGDRGGGCLCCLLLYSQHYINWLWLNTLNRAFYNVFTL